MQWLSTYKNTQELAYQVEVIRKGQPSTVTIQNDLCIIDRKYVDDTHFYRHGLNLLQLQTCGYHLKANTLSRHTQGLEPLVPRSSDTAVIITLLPCVFG